MTSHIDIEPLHPSFGASVAGVDFSKPVPREVQQEIQNALNEYGVLVFRATALDDQKHVDFAKMFGAIDKLNIPPGSGIKARFETDELQDQGNLGLDGNVLPDESPKAHFNKVWRKNQDGNLLFHVDNSYHPQRVKYSMLRAVDLPPPGTGGNTEFVDTRRAWDDLPETWKQELQTKDYRVRHSMWHSRKLASPEFFARLDITKYPSSLRRLVQKHPDTGRTLLYLAAHCFEIEGLSAVESKEKLDFLLKHASQEKHLLSIPWLHNGDFMLWDNRCVMHRGQPLTGPHKRDLRRATILDEGPEAWSFDAKDYDFMKFWSAAFHVMQQYGDGVQEQAKKQLGISGMDVTGLDKEIPRVA
ncbi:Alpha-ketoglutarate-dependent 2,4-dichlorophenoxyacetate dioxygenase 2 [Colletotrichum chlorophyti]|uniref:Alpha-ketoglutarate-dependent 2,4-dichlorophenoxyacetate dioxygenase 2 n=1 Tax=Colletotrichum chlorophyti TaxID=708187 RepID=A0A1Q8S2Q8_9PEZI|nr:Alpha-ketoglutarate-dependent 2,4-dichlorophenoxyacetate dioxygenase 2 [Colletotrichum chlorophyti]